MSTNKLKRVDIASLTGFKFNQVASLEVGVAAQMASGIVLHNTETKTTVVIGHKSNLPDGSSYGNSEKRLVYLDISYRDNPNDFASLSKYSLPFFTIGLSTISIGSSDKPSGLILNTHIETHATHPDFKCKACINYSYEKVDSHGNHTHCDLSSLNIWVGESKDPFSIDYADLYPDGAGKEPPAPALKNAAPKKPSQTSRAKNTVVTR